MEVMVNAVELSTERARTAVPFPNIRRSSAKKRRFFDHPRSAQIKNLAFNGKRVKGIEPSCPAWEAGVLPLNYTRIGRISDFRFRIADWQWAIIARKEDHRQLKTVLIKITTVISIKVNASGRVFGLCRNGQFYHETTIKAAKLPAAQLLR